MSESRGVFPYVIFTVYLIVCVFYGVCFTAWKVL